MNDDKPQMPPQPKTTVELPAVPPWAIELTQNVKELTATVSSMATGLQNQADAQLDFGRRLTGVEVRMSALEERQASASLRAQAPSAHDLQAQAELAQEKVAREALATMVTALDTKVDGVATEVADTRAELARNSASTEMIRSAVTGVSGFLKQHPQIVTAIATFLAAALGWGTHALSTGAHP